MKICYYCGRTNAEKYTKDHVPPKCIFPKNKPKNLITVPCCFKCNKEMSSLDQKMRNWMGLLSTKMPKEISQRIFRDFKKDMKSFNDYLSHIKAHNKFIDSKGFPRLSYYPNLAEVNIWLARIIKGLFYKREKRPIVKNVVFSSELLSWLKIPSTEKFPMEQGLEFRPYFTYYDFHDGDCLDTSTWFIIFYDIVAFLVRAKMR